MSSRKPRRGRYWARRWHRWLGVVFVLPLLWLTVSGLALRYAEELGLDDVVVESKWVLRKYGMFPEGAVREAVAGERVVSEWDEVLFLDGKMLEEVGELKGAVVFGNMVVVGVADYLLAYSASGQWEQKLGEESLPGVPVEMIGVTGDGRVAVKEGGRVWAFDEELIGYAESDPGEVSWSEVRPGKEEAAAGLEGSIARQAGIPWSRVMLDLHSGNLGGTSGKLLVDVSGIGIIVMSLMGIKLMFRKPRGGAGG